MFNKNKIKKTIFKKKRSIYSLLILIAFIMNLMLPNVVLAEENNGDIKTVTISVERRVLGQEDIIEKTKVELLKEDEQVSKILDRVLKENGLDYDYTGTIDQGFYLSYIELKNGEWLGEFDHGDLSGWRYSVDGVFPNFGMADYKVKGGEDIRICYTAKDMGNDILFVDNLDKLKDKIEYGYTIDKSKYTEESYSNLEKVLSSAKDVVDDYKDIGKLLSVVLGDGNLNINDANSRVNEQLNNIKEALDGLEVKTEPIEPQEPEKPEKPEVPEVPENPELPNKEEDIKDAISDASQWVLNNVEKPSYTNEWAVFGLSRNNANVPEGYYEEYYNNLKDTVIEKKGQLHRVKYTEYSRVIITLNALGYDPTDVGGYNLVEKLFDLANVSKQGINGIIFALIALDTKDYKIPEGSTATRENLINAILKNQKSDGGFALRGDEGEVDITSMSIQALSRYREQNSDVKESIDRALDFLSEKQLSTGGFATSGFGTYEENVESSSQVLVALNSLGLGFDDKRFVKDGNTIINAIMKFRCEDGGFKHLLSNPGSNGMATEQALYALVSQNRLLNGQTSLYDMSDVGKDDQDQDQDDDNITNPGDNTNPGDSNDNDNNSGNEDNDDSDKDDIVDDDNSNNNNDITPNNPTTTEKDDSEDNNSEQLGKYGSEIAILIPIVGVIAIITGTVLGIVKKKEIN